MFPVNVCPSKEMKKTKQNFFFFLSSDIKSPEISDFSLDAAYACRTDIMRLSERTAAGLTPFWIVKVLLIVGGDEHRSGRRQDHRSGWRQEHRSGRGLSLYIATASVPSLIRTDICREEKARSGSAACRNF